MIKAFYRLILALILEYIRYLEINRNVIARLAGEKEEENDAFRDFLKQADGVALDKKVHALNGTISTFIDCTQCGACCKSLMINIVAAELSSVADQLQLSEEDFKEQYIETSSQGQMIMKSIPCSFLHADKCTVYEQRFAECREFPHLHKDNFKGRLFGTLVHYAMCPIIFNVVEELKIETGFKEREEAQATGAITGF